ncbi:MAG TPA: DUF6325 family protein [Ktedonobacterales bacterium]
MAMGPLQYLVIGFEGNHFTGEILPELHALRDRGIIRLVDLFFVQKSQTGQITVRELSDLSGEEAKPYGPLAGELLGLFTQEDIETIASELPNQSSDAIVLFENTWAVGLRDAIARANGVLLDQRLIAPSDVEALAQELAASYASTDLASEYQAQA